MRPFNPKVVRKYKEPVKVPFVQEQLRIEVVEYYPEIQPKKEKEEDRRGVTIIDVF